MESIPSSLKNIGGEILVGQSSFTKSLRLPCLFKHAFYSYLGSISILIPTIWKEIEPERVCMESFNRPSLSDAHPLCFIPLELSCVVTEIKPYNPTSKSFISSPHLGV